eukprot:3941214-Rhodomonas_salina.9
MSACPHKQQQRHQNRERCALSSSSVVARIRFRSAEFTVPTRLQASTRFLLFSFIVPLRAVVSVRASSVVLRRACLFALGAHPHRRAKRAASTRLRSAQPIQCRGRTSAVGKVARAAEAEGDGKRPAQG